MQPDWPNPGGITIINLATQPDIIINEALGYLTERTDPRGGHGWAENKGPVDKSPGKCLERKSIQIGVQRQPADRKIYFFLVE